MLTPSLEVLHPIWCEMQPNARVVGCGTTKRDWRDCVMRSTRRRVASGSEFSKCSRLKAKAETGGEESTCNRQPRAVPGIAMGGDHHAEGETLLNTIDIATCS